MSQKNNAVHGESNNFHIFVNSRERSVPGPTINYEGVIKLAFPDPGTFTYVVTYSGPNMPDGTLAQGGKPVKLTNGMKFDVLPTNRS